MKMITTILVTLPIWYGFHLALTVFYVIKRLSLTDCAERKMNVFPTIGSLGHEEQGQGSLDFHRHNIV